jgi:uncharacterized protein (TIGR02391 family)
MILTDQEMRQLRHTLEANAGLDEELLQRCAPLMHMGKFDEAVRNAFVLLEERLRTAVDKPGMTGTNVARHAFDAETGPLSKHLGRTKQERLGLENLFTGAFRLFRNPTAHTFIDYDTVEGKAIISFVNLLLTILRRAEELPPPATFIEPVENALTMIEQQIGEEVAGRIRIFLGRCQKLGLKSVSAKSSLPFRTYALQIRDDWIEAKPHHVTLFYLMANEKNPSFWFPVDLYYSTVVGLDTNAIAQQLRALGFYPTGGKSRDYRLNLRDKNDPAFFEELYTLVEQIYGQFAATL